MRRESCRAGREGAVSAPERIWVLAGSVVKVLRRDLYNNERNRGGDTEYVRADIHAALKAERDDLKRVLSVDPDEWRRAQMKADRVLALEAKCERLEWLWAQAENLDPDLVEGAERAWAALEGRKP